MKLDPQWQTIARRAWSFRLIALAAVLTGLEVLLPLWSDRIERGTFALLSLVVVVAALVARIVAQKDVP